MSSLDSGATLKPKGVVRLSGGLHPDGDSDESAGVAPNGTESVQGKDEEGSDFFRWLMESNEPVAGISATNSDWSFPEDYNHGGRY